MNSYQKLKAENEQLKREIIHLVNDDSEAVFIKMKYKIKQDLARIVFAGSPTSTEDTTFKGIFFQIQ